MVTVANNAPFLCTSFTHGQFGENFTVEGLPDDEVCIGDRYLDRVRSDPHQEIRRAMTAGSVAARARAAHVLKTIEADQTRRTSMKSEDSARRSPPMSMT